MTFKSDLNDDLTDVFFDPDEFADEVIYTDRTANAVFIYGNFDAEGISAAGVATTNPTLTCRTVDVAGAVPGETITRNGTVYAIAEPPRFDEDSPGVTILELTEA